MLLLAGCSALGIPNLGLTAGSSASPTDSALPSSVPTSEATPWWAWPPGITTCGTPAINRVGDRTPSGLGSCAGFLVDPPDKVVVHVGQELDIHIVTDSTMRAPYALPESPDPAILRDLGHDDPTTGRYLAVAEGDVVLITAGLCLDVQTDRQSTRPCPLVAVMVLPAVAGSSPSAPPAPSLTDSPAPSLATPGLSPGAMQITGVLFFDDLNGIAVGRVPTEAVDRGAVVWTTAPAAWPPIRLARRINRLRRQVHRQVCCSNPHPSLR